MRAERRDDGYVPELPSVDGAAYLVAYLWDMGPTMVAGMGLGPLTHEEIRAWQSNTGVWLQPWEARILRQLSMDYIVQMRDAEKNDCPPPWSAARARGRSFIGDRQDAPRNSCTGRQE